MQSSLAMYDRIQIITQRMETAAKSSGRDPKDVKLVGACKTMPAEIILEAAQNGLKIAAENRVQEFREKFPVVGQKIIWHFIGQLQANKVKYMLGHVELFHSLDRLSTAQEMQRLCQQREISCQALLQVNIGRETSKGGVLPDKALEFLDGLSSFPNVSIAGLMAIPPFDADENQARMYFAQMRKLQDDLVKRGLPDNVCLRELSMGMSHDYEIAIAEGATLVRIGTALFGLRN